SMCVYLLHVLMFRIILFITNGMYLRFFLLGVDIVLLLKLDIWTKHLVLILLWVLVWRVLWFLLLLLLLLLVLHLLLILHLLLLQHLLLLHVKHLLLLLILGESLILVKLY